jgi:hypothetical protein
MCNIDALKKVKNVKYYFKLLVLITLMIDELIKCGSIIDVLGCIAFVR